MAIIVCPACGNKTSTIHDQCAHCGAALPAQRESPVGTIAAAPRPVRRTYIGVQSFLAILLTMVGFLWYYRASGGLQFPPPNRLSIFTIAAGVVWYIALRLWMVFRRLDRDDN